MNGPGFVEIRGRALVVSGVNCKVQVSLLKQHLERHSPIRTIFIDVLNEWTAGIRVGRIAGQCKES